jgi:hypothetical protein
MSSSDSDDSKGGQTVSTRSVIILTGSDNYAKWSRSITAYLMSRSLLSALKDAPLLPRASITGGGSPLPPSTSKEVTLHPSDDNLSTRTNASRSAVSDVAGGKSNRGSERKNEKAWSYIYLHLSDTVQNNLTAASADAMNPDASLLWKELRRNYGVSSLQELGVRMEVIWGTAIPDNQNPDRYFARMRSAYNDVIGNKTPFADNLFAIALLRSLPSSYSVIAQSLYQRNSLTSEDVITSVRTEWQRQDTTVSTSTALAAGAAHSRVLSVPRRDTNNRDYRNKDTSSANESSDWACPIHRTNGHDLRECRTVLNRVKNPPSNSRANVAQQSDSTEMRQLQHT